MYVYLKNLFGLFFPSKLFVLRICSSICPLTCIYIFIIYAFVLTLFHPISAESSSSGEDSGDEDAEKDEDEDKKPETKTVKEKTYEWELLNDVKAVWLRNPKEVTEDEYLKFYQSLAKVYFQLC